MYRYLKSNLFNGLLSLESTGISNSFSHCYGHQSLYSSPILCTVVFDLTFFNEVKQSNDTIYNINAQVIDSCTAVIISRPVIREQHLVTKIPQYFDEIPRSAVSSLPEKLSQWKSKFIERSGKCHATDFPSVTIPPYAKVHVGLPIDHCYILLVTFNMDYLVVSLSVAMIEVDLELLRLQ